MIEDLLGFNPLSSFEQIGQLLASPVSNVPAFMLLLAVVVVVFGIVTVSILLVILSRNDAEERDEEPEEFIESHPVEVVVDPAERWRGRLVSLVFLIALVALMWVATGVSTAFVSACAPCHDDSLHATLKDSQEHGDTSCVRCHEPGGLAYSTTAGVPARVAHIYEGLRGLSPMSEYGLVASSACQSCHASGIAETTDNKRRGIKMAHVEPLEAGARCTDCHRPNEQGVVVGTFAGMEPCLRCHDGEEASADCELCHTNDIGTSAAADHQPSPQTAKTLVSAPYDCYACHSSNKCDACHGVRLPHTGAFLADHDYEGAKSIWSGSTGTCAKCHTAERRSCSTPYCHSVEFPYHYSHDPNFGRNHAASRWVRTGPGYSGVSVMGCAQCHGDNVCTRCHESRPPIKELPEPIVIDD